MMDAFIGADALVNVTEWKAFQAPDFNELRPQLKQPIIFVGRNLYELKQEQEQDFEYFPRGRL